MEVFYDAASTGPTGKVQRMVATGNVTLANGAEAAEADHAVYEVAAGTIAMDGNVLLTQGQNALSSERLDIDLNKGTGRLEGRVQTIFVPGSQPGATREPPAREPAARPPDGRGRRPGSRCSNLAKSYKGRPVLRDVSLSLRRGEVAALLGPNGAGKTTCFYAIAGLVPPDRGTILIDGQEVTWLPMYRRAKLGIGYLPQEASIFRGMTVADNIRAILEITVPDPDKRHEMLDELMGEFSITHLRRAPAIALSGGERRRVEIARCLAAQPNYVLLDEPFAGVDPLAVMDIRNAGPPSQGPRHRGADHRPQRARDVGNRRPCLYPARRDGPDDRDARGSGARRQCTAGLPWRELPHLRRAAADAADGALAPHRAAPEPVAGDDAAAAAGDQAAADVEPQLADYLAAEVEKNPLLELAPAAGAGVRRRGAAGRRRRRAISTRWRRR